MLEKIKSQKSYYIRKYSLKLLLLSEMKMLVNLKQRKNIKSVLNMLFLQFTKVKRTEDKKY